MTQRHAIMKLALFVAHFRHVIIEILPFPLVFYDRVKLSDLLSFDFRYQLNM